MNCPEHLAWKGFNGRVYVWMYWYDVPRHRIPLRVWMNMLRYEVFIRGVATINREGRWAHKLSNAIFRIKRIGRRNDH